MRTPYKWLIRGGMAILVAALVVGYTKREELARLWAVNTLFAEDRIVGNFSDMGTAFLTAPVPRGDGPVSPLPVGEPFELSDGMKQWVELRSATSLLVLHRGKIVFEEYYQGTTAQDKRISWSVAKSFLSALMGVIVAEGHIDSLDDPVTKYAPDLVGSAYDGATIRNVLNMSSGVTFDEDYGAFTSDINRMGRVLALGGSMDAFATTLTETFAPPGTEWQYVSIDTHVLGMVIRGATGRRVIDLMSEKIIAPLGLEVEPTYLTDGLGEAFVLGGLNLTTRDYARFGQMIAQDGRWNGQQIVPGGWIDVSTRASAPGGAGYGYQWWIPAQAELGQVMARGIYGQYIWIDRRRNIVIVMTGTDRDFGAPRANEMNEAGFRAIAEDLE